MYELRFRFGGAEAYIIESLRREALQRGALSVETQYHPDLQRCGTLVLTLGAKDVAADIRNYIINDLIYQNLFKEDRVWW